MNARCGLIGLTRELCARCVCVRARASSSQARHVVAVWAAVCAAMETAARIRTREELIGRPKSAFQRLYDFLPAFLPVRLLTRFPARLLGAPCRSLVMGGW